jgi:hypothetical protein
LNKWGRLDARNARQIRNEHCAPSRDVLAQLLELDCDPIAGMAKLAQDEATPCSLRARMFAELAPYIAPLRARRSLARAAYDIPTRVGFVRSPRS